MRFGVVITGIVVLGVGIALWYVPLTGPSTSADVPQTSGLIVHDSAPLSILTTNFAWTATWAATSNISVSVYDCGTDSNCVSPSIPLVTGSGPSGSISWTGEKGHYFVIVPSDATAITADYNVPLVGGAAGLGLTLLGVIILAAGVVLKKPLTPTPKP